MSDSTIQIRNKDSLTSKVGLRQHHPCPNLKDVDKFGPLNVYVDVIQTKHITLRHEMVTDFLILIKDLLHCVH